MKVSTLGILFALGMPMFLFGCGGDDNETGSLSIRITDAKPLLEVDGSTVHDEDVATADLEPGEAFSLNLGLPI